jgi:phosphoesterase RecJ-like protein
MMQITPQPQPILPEQIKALLLGATRIILTTHVNPDGDGIGSELAVANALRQLGKAVTVVNHNATPDNYTWLDPHAEIVQFSPDRDAAVVLAADLIIILDTNQPDRLRSLEPFVRQSSAPKLIIDHHLSPHPFAQHYVIDVDATSTGEIVYRMLKALPVRMTHAIAVALYTAIMTDTGSFRYPRTDPETHAIVADLIASGADPSVCYSNVYEQWTPGRMRLLGEVLDSMRTACDGELAWVVCTQKMFRDTGTSEVETDNFTTYPMSIRGVRVGILFNELPDGVKISFRSKGAIPINKLAMEFGGGGHLNAAGARLFNSSLDQVVPKVIDLARRYLGHTSRQDAGDQTKLS